MFFSCGQKVPTSEEFVLLSLTTTTDGQVVQTLDFSVGTRKFQERGINELEIINFKNQLINEVKTFHDEFLLNFAIIYSTNPDPLYKIGNALILSAVTYDETTDSVGFDMVFASANAWEYYHPSNGDVTGGELENGLILKNVSKGVFPFASEVRLSSGEITTVGQRYIDAYKNALNAAGINEFTELYYPDFVYNYATPASHLKSDSEYFFQDGGLNHHVWLRSAKNYLDKPNIELYVMDLNLGYFYLLILLIPLVGLGVYVIVIKLKEKRKPN